MAIRTPNSRARARSYRPSAAPPRTSIVPASGGVNPAMLRTCARYGQGWNTTPVSVPQVREHLRTLSAVCAEAGRSADELEKSLEMQVLIAPDRETLRQRLQAIVDLDPSGQAPNEPLRAFLAGETDAVPEMDRVAIIGTPDNVRQRIQEYIDAGITHFMLWFLDAPSDEGMTLFAEHVLPAFRATSV